MAEQDCLAFVGAAVGIRIDDNQPTLLPAAVLRQQGYHAAAGDGLGASVVDGRQQVGGGGAQLASRQHIAQFRQCGGEQDGENGKDDHQLQQREAGPRACPLARGALQRQQLREGPVARWSPLLVRIRRSHCGSLKRLSTLGVPGVATSWTQSRICWPSQALPSSS